MLHHLACYMCCFVWLEHSSNIPAPDLKCLLRFHLRGFHIQPSYICPGISLLPRHGLFLRSCRGQSVINQFFTVWGNWPHAQSPIWRTRARPLSDLFPRTNPVWLNPPGTDVPADIALGISEAIKLHHHNKVRCPWVDSRMLSPVFLAQIVLRIHRPAHGRFKIGPAGLYRRTRITGSLSFSFEGGNLGKRSKTPFDYPCANS